jgi:hypothetical protein
MYDIIILGENMEIFNKFRNTVFLKEDSNLEKQLNELKNIRGKLENTDEIDKDIKLLEYGIAGEKEIAFELKNANIGMYVLHDVTFECDGNKAQIDYLLFTRGYFYLIECKNLIGNLTVDSNGQFYREYDYKGKKIKESIYSPYTQAVRHQDIIKKVWSANHSKLDNFIFNIFNRKNFFRPIVVLSNSKCFLNTKYAPNEIKNNIIRADQLISYIQKDIDNMQISELSGEKTLKQAAEVWFSRSIPNDASLANKYLNAINDKSIKADLEDELKLFRKEKSKSMNVPAYYIFTDEEMNDLLSIMPRTVEELKTRKILTDIKIKCHGEEIIKILNK